MKILRLVKCLCFCQKLKCVEESKAKSLQGSDQENFNQAKKEPAQIANCAKNTSMFSANSNEKICSKNLEFSKVSSANEEQPLPLVRTIAHTVPSTHTEFSSKPSSTYQSSGSPDQGASSVNQNSDEILSTSSFEYFVFLWGSNTVGQLLTSAEGYGPFRIEKFSQQCIAQVECGVASTWIVSESGNLWAGGLNHKGQISPSETEEKPQICSANRIEEFETYQVKSVSSGEDHATIILSSGVVISFGSNEFGQLGHGEGTEAMRCVMPKRLFNITVPVSQVVCGYAHTVLLSSTGQVFTCGNGSDGCLGDGQGTSRSTFQPVPSLFGVPIQQVCSGPEHSLALSLSGHIFSWGRNKRGCLGLGKSSEHFSIISTPHQVDPMLPTFKFITTGQAHTIAIASGGRLYACGDNNDGQLGENPELVDYECCFKQVEVGEKTRLAACGDKHTALICHTGEIITFGRNKEGQLGHGNALEIDSAWKPRKVEFHRNEGRFNDLFFYTISAGGDHTAAAGIKIPEQFISASNEFCDKNGPIITTPKVSSLQRVNSVNQIVEQMIRPMSSRLALLRNHSELGSRTLTNTPLYRSSTCSRHNSTCPTPIFGDEWLSKVVSRGVKGRPNLSQFQSFLSVGGIKSTVSLKESSADKDDLLLPAGCSVGEILERIQLIKNATDPEEELRKLKKRLNTVFSDIHRLNCSFLMPTRLAVIDSDGVEQCYTALESINALTKPTIEAELYSSMWKCLDSVDQFAHHFITHDQIRFIAIILQSPFLKIPTAATIRLFSKLVNIVFLCPSQGRQALSFIFQQHYTADIFVRRILFNTKQFLNTVIAAQGNHYQTVPTIWHGVILMHLMYRASVEWGADDKHKALELTLDSDKNKVPVEAFTLEAIAESVDPVQEHRFYREHTKSTTTQNSMLNSEMSIPSEMTIIFSNVPTPPPTIPVVSDSLKYAENISNNLRTSGREPVLLCEQTQDTMNTSEEAPPRSDQRVITVTTPELTSDEVLNITELKQNWTFFLAHMWLCPLKFKRNVINVEAAICQRQICVRSVLSQSMPFFLVSVRRSHLVEDALNIILCSPPENLLKPLRVTFDGEQGVDEGGLKREFFSILVEILFDENYGMFVYNSDTRTVWFNRNTIDTKKEFFLIGVVLGLALYNDILLNLKFPCVLYKKLQNKAINLNDLADVFPEEGKSFHTILHWPSDEKESFNEAFDTITFSVDYDYFGETRSVELVPHGKEQILTFDNRQEYVSLYVKYLLSTSVEAQFSAFQEGFSRFQTVLVKGLSGGELQLLICGSLILDFNHLKDGAIYEGYNESDQYMKDFWDILFSLDIEKKKKFLQFCTGSDRVPLGGLKELQLKIQKNGVEPTDRLPTAFTCFNCLLLPLYSNKEKLMRLLVVAIEQSQGFGLQ